MSSGAQLLWLDMEMTGLDVEKEVPIEVAAIVTGWDMNPIDQYYAVIKQPQKYLNAMDDWNKKHHGESGLTAAIATGKEPGVVDEELAAFIKKHFWAGPAILAGNSIGQDRLFIKRYLPKTESCLHYRMVDVTSFKVLYNGMFNLKFKKQDAHRALDDIRESIAELKYYLSFVKHSESKS